MDQKDTKRNSARFECGLFLLPHSGESRRASNHRRYCGSVTEQSGARVVSGTATLTNTGTGVTQKM